MMGKYCKHCSEPAVGHVVTWLEEIGNQAQRLLFRHFKARWLEKALDIGFAKFFTALGAGEFTSDYVKDDFDLRTWCLIEETRRRGLKLEFFKGPRGFTPHARIIVNNKVVLFDGLPNAYFASQHDKVLLDDKQVARKHFIKADMPVPQGRTFWFGQKRWALRYGVKKLGFPLTVKPRSGFYARHVTTRIENFSQLRQAIDLALQFSPSYVVERFLADMKVYRATVVDFDYVVVVEQVPAHIIGNGRSSIRELIDKKNSDPRRGEPSRKQFTLFKIVENDITQELLETKGYSVNSVPAKDEAVYLQRDPFLKLGGDLRDVTRETHVDNLELFKQAARHFDTRLTGIDFLAEDISRSWHEQKCGLIEINRDPSFEVHHFPTQGQAYIVAEPVIDLIYKYYLK